MVELKRITQEQVDYLREFIVELLDKYKVKGIDNLEDFLSQIEEGYDGLFPFRIDEGIKYKLIPGYIDVIPVGVKHNPRALVCIYYEPLFQSDIVFLNQVREISESNEVPFLNSPAIDIPNTRKALTFAEIPVFREDGSRLTVDELIEKYVSKLSSAAQKVLGLEIRLHPELYQQ